MLSTQPNSEVGLTGGIGGGTGNGNGGGTHVGHVSGSGGFAASAGGGLLGFLQAYPNPLTRLGFASVSSTSGSSAGLPSIPEGEVIAKEGGVKESGTGDKTTKGSEGDVGAVAERSPEGSGISLLGPRKGELLRKDILTGLTRRQYQFSTLVFVALIAFLIGSLLRSLLSPADFIYVVKDLGEAEESNVSTTGWREIRRLLEIKYLVGGWDFQVAVVRRH